MQEYEQLPGAGKSSVAVFAFGCAQILIFACTVSAFAGDVDPRNATASEIADFRAQCGFDQVDSHSVSLFELDNHIIVQSQSDCKGDGSNLLCRTFFVKKMTGTCVRGPYLGTELIQDDSPFAELSDVPVFAEVIPSEFFSDNTISYLYYSAAEGGTALILDSSRGVFIFMGTNE